jgi:hypothetical protein
MDPLTKVTQLPVRMPNAPVVYDETREAAEIKRADLDRLDRVIEQITARFEWLATHDKNGWPLPDAEVGTLDLNAAHCLAKLIALRQQLLGSLQAPGATNVKVAGAQVHLYLPGNHRNDNYGNNE